MKIAFLFQSNHNGRTQTADRFMLTSTLSIGLNFLNCIIFWLAYQRFRILASAPHRQTKMPTNSHPSNQLNLLSFFKDRCSSKSRTLELLLTRPLA